ncbi:hypothetical protein PPL_05048 [Heterostelium album PN500]|uniref:Uncharacterized protein n=1 Tax=Heterostelium pallidum (strain ATCC 26659 / Pp 5 / PN500) TaxID=670386 RepID=D3B9A4_HETP5|nr:hypothetical protein PPL_05048 [Heterostelium album PN500]EFA81816.1 hypothetical protein PPL_05048 [Heterostelium album PN500]|eukprot:XP_020433933.1 hypothetical protein PPL_05048 [Heterostelium album PN500]
MTDNKSNNNYKCRIWYITGISQGLGLTLVRECLLNGDKVVGTTRNPDVQELKDIASEHSESFMVLKVDLTNEDAVKDSIDQTIKRFGGIDVVVNNAGYGLLGSLEELKPEEIRTHFEVNLFAVINVLRHAVGHLRQQPATGGNIINISSIVGFNSSLPGNVSYAATKYALGGLSEALAKEMEPFNVKVTIVYPGCFRTNFFAGSYRVASEPIECYKTKETEQECLASQGKQRGDPEKAAKVIYQLTRIPEGTPTPLHLFLGPDANEMAQQKIDILQHDLNQWKSITDSTDIYSSAIKLNKINTNRIE